ADRERLLSSALKLLRQAFKVPKEKGRELWIALCQYCGSFSLWLGERMLYPQTGEAPPPHPDMPPAIRELYEEARGVLPASPRASAALLRVALEGLLEEAGNEKGSLADRLKRAHEEGKLTTQTYKLAGVLRLGGNAAAHYELWKIDPSQGQEDREMILALFEFLNEVTEELIAKPKRLEEMERRLLQVLPLLVPPLAYALVGLGGGFNAMVLAQTASLAADSAGRAMALVNVTGVSGIFAIQTSFGLAVERVGYSVALLGLALFQGLALVGAMRIHREVLGKGSRP
ncbi:DUF4145 domain-containing protein, partial [Thermus scotoductus]|uniref:DUF4145 domain-containing protein n=1 Tax=Thermus scotoductus TaxID=37636 RepID=UPI0020A2F5CC